MSGDTRGFGDIFDSLLEKYKASGALTQSTTIEQFLPQIKQIAADVQKAVGDGFQWSDVLVLMKIAKPLMLLVKDADGLANSSKCAFVKEAIWLAYKTYDDGPGGDENNIDIPILFGPFERKVEEIVIPLIAEVLVSGLYDELKATQQL